MSFHPRCWVVGLLCALWLVPQDADGQALGDTGGDSSATADSTRLDAARRRYQEGARAYSEGRYKEAIDLFRDAARLAPKPAFSYNIGLAYESLGDQANALKWYRDYLRREPDAPDRDEVRTRIEAAEAYLSQRGVQQVTILSSPDGATVYLDEDPVGVTPWTGEVVPGEHMITLMRRGYRDATKSFMMPPDEAIDVFVALKRRSRAPGSTDASGVEETAPEPAPLSDAGPSDDAGSPRVRPLTWSLLGGGVAGLATSLGLELGRESAEDAARDPERTQVDRKEDYDRARSFQTAARVAVGVGAAATVLGGVLLYIDLSADEPEPRARGLSMGCSVASCNVRFKGTF